MEYQANPARYDTMKYRCCGRSGLKLPVLSLGLWHNFGGVDIFETGRAIVREAFDAGITHFDLANNYGPPPGSAEENFGRILKMDFQAHRDELVISTKAGYTMWPGPYGDWGSKKYLTASLDQSLQRLGLGYVDIFYSHRFDPETPLEETMGALSQAVRQGKALYVGISNYPPEQTRRAVEILEAMGCRCLVHQVRYSMLDRRLEEGLLDLHERLGLGCTVFSPLEQGILTERYLEGIPGDSRAAKPHGFLTPDRLEEATLARVRRLKEIAAERGQTVAQLALAWVLRDPRVTSAVVGVSRVEQLRDNLRTLDRIELTTEELNRIEQVLAS
ncbi:MAG TPA: L-glyceraldehyde 3-phosphate reductase [Acidobacteriota bacterium]|jgi:L-glyceraldehyde 3-phosphate reductase|nr:L-glyceraldehyde 3-phosphate reductase [Acidobacteriota bacterium]HRR57108.1 L-glyceraldehyde 3-phosphate reductase [Acidobacteriota bacterium]HRV08873.1 L-glyceraldehyde 3-phosphate reductase [Acidobacteriota bacterium]